MGWPPSTSLMDAPIPSPGLGDILRASHVDGAKASSPARVAAELANPTTRRRLLSLARWIMKVNAPKEERPSDADAEDLVQTAVALAYDPEKKPWLPPKTFLTHMAYVMKDVFPQPCRPPPTRFKTTNPTLPH